MTTIREHIVDGDKSAGEFHIVKTQDCEDILKVIKEMPDHNMKQIINTQKGHRYLGSVPNLIAVEWAKEWGVRLYSKEWNEKAARRLKHDPDWNSLRMRQNYRY